MSKRFGIVGMIALALGALGCQERAPLGPPLPASEAPCIGTLSACGVATPPDLAREHRDANDWQVRRFALAATAGDEVIVEGERNLQIVGVYGAGGEEPVRVRSATVAEPSFVSLEGVPGPATVYVARRAYPSRAIWPYQVRVGAPSAAASFVTNHVVATSFVAVWALVVAALQLVYAMSPRNRAGAFAVAAAAAIQGLRATAMQYHWSSWWAATPGVAYALEVATLPLGQFAIVRFYGWVAGVDFRGRVHRVREALLVALAIAALSGVLVPALWLPTLRIAQLGMALTVLFTVVLVRRIVASAEPGERRFVTVGYAAQAVGVVLDLVVALRDAPLFLGIGFAGVGFIVETLAQTAIVAARNSRAHDRIEELAATLETSNARIARANVDLKRLDKLKDEFLANTSHELRTPLHGILGLTESVHEAEPNLSAKSRDRLEMVMASGQRLLSLVNDLLDFSRLQHGAIALREKEIPLRQAVNLVMAVLSPLAESKGLDLVNEVSEGLRVRADEGRLQQILTNLVGNAVKFTHVGRVIVGADAEGARVSVHVQDTGIGIADEALGRIFESFVQGDGATSRQFGGTGLGLTVSQKLVELHGGTLRVSSQLGVGSTFTFDVARASDEGVPAHGLGSMVLGLASAGALELADLNDPERHERERVVPEAPAERADDDVASERVSLGRLLVADDDPVNIEVLRAQLEPRGYAIVAARDGQEALETLEAQGPFDGVLLDVMMPRLTGPEAAARIREDYPQGTLPIVMLTAKTRPEDVVVGLKAGANDYLSKPFHRDELSTRLDVHLDASKTTRALERFVSPALVAFAGEAKPAALQPGQGCGRNAIVGRVSIGGLSELAARLDEATFFRRVNGIVHALVQQVEDHGGIVETMVDDGLCVLFEGDAEAAIATLTHALGAAREIAANEVRLGAVLHAGHVNVGVVGTPQWVSLRAMGESVLLAGALGRWSALRGFDLLVTDAVVAKLDDRRALRRVGTARVGTHGHPVTLFEALGRDDDAVDLDAAVELLERGRFAEVLALLGDVAHDDALVTLLRASAEERVREHLLR